MATPLEGIRVIDWTQFLMGPRTGAHLADMGAEVIKIEHPQGGDPTRAAVGGVLPDPKGYSYTFHTENRGKKSMTLDLNHAESREIAHKLIKTADVFLSNVQAHVLKRFSLDYDTLSRLNPRLVYALGSGWGYRGPDKDRPAFDYTVWAQSGLMDSLGEPDSPPVSCRPGLGDHFTAVTLAYGIMLALYHRERTGEGQFVHASLYGCLLDMGAVSLAAHLGTGEEAGRRSRKEMGNPLWNFYQTKDGQWVQFAMTQSERHWADFCKALGMEHLQHDPHFDTHAHRDQNHRELIEIMDGIMASRAKEEWIQRFQGLNVIYAFVASYPEVARDPQVWENDYIVKVNLNESRQILMAGLPVNLSKTPGQTRNAGPELGQNTEELLLELGYSWEDIIALKDKGAIG